MSLWSDKRYWSMRLVFAYLLTIVFANATLALFGLVPIGFGLYAPAGVYFAGLALTLRDGVQETLGRHAVLAAIAVGAALSWFLSPAFGVASGVAFLLSEAVDYAVYTPLRERGRVLLAIGLSNTVGAAADSALFLVLAFGSLQNFWGQMLGKSYITLGTVALFAGIRYVVSLRRDNARPAVAGELGG